MVKLVEIEDESAYDSDSQYTTDSGDESGFELSDKEELDSEFEDDEDDYLDESLLERLAALKEIVPAQQRLAISRVFGTIGLWGGLGMKLAGKLSWVFTTSALLVVFPLALETDRDKMMQQWESEQQQQGQQPMPGQGPSMVPGQMPPGLAGPGMAAPGMAGPAPGLA
ncbi:mitochondrial import receptor subunit Tom22 [Coemansia sp. RSA 552]|nr:mitochondrial import receptor subunit Tom22 [Coemansia sp. RSA 552]